MARKKKELTFEEELKLFEQLKNSDNWTSLVENITKNHEDVVGAFITEAPTSVLLNEVDERGEISECFAYIDEDAYKEHIRPKTKTEKKAAIAYVLGITDLWPDDDFRTLLNGLLK